MKPTILCQFDKFSCFGCCGNHWGTKNEITRDIKRHTHELRIIRDLVKFRDREDKDLLDRSGSCFNLVFLDKGRVGCKLHPAQTGGEDLRKGHCDIDYLCPTAKAFEKWPEEKQRRFLDFLRSKNHNYMTYSLKMDRNVYLNEFERAEEKDE